MAVARQLQPKVGSASPARIAAHPDGETTLLGCPEARNPMGRGRDGQTLQPSPPAARPINREEGGHTLMDLFLAAFSQAKWPEILALSSATAH